MGQPNISLLGLLVKYSHLLVLLIVIGIFILLSRESDEALYELA